MSVSDLTGTSWVFNDVLSFPGILTYAINFVCAGSSYSALDFFHRSAPPPLSGVDSLMFDSITVYSFNNSSWSDSAYKSIYITGGADVANDELIAWITTNATQQSSQLSVDLTTLSGWSDVSAGNHTLKVKAKATGYRDSALSTGVGFEKAASGYEVELSGDYGDSETVYVQINDDPTWYYAEMLSGRGFGVSHSNIPDVHEKDSMSIAIPNVSKIKIGTGVDPALRWGPEYMPSGSTGDFTNLTFSAGGPGYATGEITMTQDSKVYFIGNY